MPGFPALFHHNLKKYICVHFKEDGALGHPSLLYGRNLGSSEMLRAQEGGTVLLKG